MVDFELYLAFCAASAALIAMPGPVVSLVIANSLRLGTRAGLTTVAGAGIGNFILIVSAAIGVTTILSLLADLFDVIRILGALFLIYMGIKAWRSQGMALPEDEQASQTRGWTLAGQAFLIGLTNPKAMLFYIAYFPQFIDPSLAVGQQVAILCVTFAGIAFVMDSGYALLAGKVRPYLMDARRAMIRARVTGALLIATGIGIALSGRHS